MHETCQAGTLIQWVREPLHNHTTRGMLQACCCIVDVAEATCGKSLSLQRNVYIFLKLPKSRPAQQAIIPVSCALRIIFEQPPERAHPTPCQPGESFPKALPMCRWRYQPWKNQREQEFSKNQRKKPEEMTPFSKKFVTFQDTPRCKV